MTNEQKIFTEAKEALLSTIEIEYFHSEIVKIYAELKQDPCPLQTLTARRGKLAVLIGLQIGGYLDTESGLFPTVIPEETATDLGLNPPTAVERLVLSNSGIPDINTLVESFKNFSSIEKINLPEVAAAKYVKSTNKVSTFVFLADPQISSAGGKNSVNPRLVNLNHMNQILNTNLSNTLWPDADNSTVSGKPIGDIDGVFLAAICVKRVEVIIFEIRILTVGGIRLITKVVMNYKP